jgi:hypothetical protein
VEGDGSTGGRKRGRDRTRINKQDGSIGCCEGGTGRLNKLIVGNDRQAVTLTAQITGAAGRFKLSDGPMNERTRERTALSLSPSFSLSFSRFLFLSVCVRVSSDTVGRTRGGY